MQPGFVALVTPDGICLDASGAAWYTDVPRQHCVRVAEGGEVLETIPLDRGGFACMLGGADGTSLYIVAARWPSAAGLGGADWEGQVLRTAASVPGAGGPRVEQRLPDLRDACRRQSMPAVNREGHRRRRHECRQACAD